MKYINQLKYPHIPYPTNVDHPEEMRETTVKSSGCGLCSLCMMVDQLTLKELPLLECLQLSVEHRANHEPGTDLKILGPVVAEKFGLKYAATDDIQEAMAAVQRGGRVVVNVGGDRDGSVGIFSHVGHYILMIAADGKEVSVLDPSLKPGKFEEEGRVGKVRVNGNVATCAYEVLDQDASNRSPRYHVFER